MTNEQAKQEAIKKAFQELGIFEVVENIHDNGWIHEDTLLPEQTSSFHFKVVWNQGRWMPEKISAIYDNNGWIRIEPDGSNFPTDGHFNVYWFDNKVSEIAQNFETVKSLFKAGLISHYKPITPELKPIY